MIVKTMIDVLKTVLENKLNKYARKRGIIKESYKQICHNKYISISINDDIRR